MVSDMHAPASPSLTPELLIRAYSAGIFPMAEHGDATEVYWVEPRWRGVIPLEGFHVPRSLARVVRKDRFRVTADTCFRDVMTACAEPRPGREETWINSEILDAYTALHQLGFAHSIECWHDGTLVGGLYGVALGGAFFGESMFSRATDASKVALVHLVSRLRQGGYQLLDTQFWTEHLGQFGTEEVPQATYVRRLRQALTVSADFRAIEAYPSGCGVAAAGGAAAGSAGGGASLTGGGVSAVAAGGGGGARHTEVSAPISGKLILQLLKETS